nr:sensor histidine kinase [Kribbella sandramycini]
MGGWRRRWGVGVGRGVVGGLGGGVVVLVGVWVVLSVRALGGGEAERSWWDPITWAGFGVLVVFLAAVGVVGLVGVQRWVALWRLAPGEREAWRLRVEQLTRSRSEVLEAVTSERRRIERDLHDGVQQRLVGLGMLLGRAQRLDDEAARALVRQAQEETQRALAELREVSWRIHPVALDDGGLSVALEELVERSAVPTTLTYDVPTRPHPASETVAYFVVREALTNALKHSQATRVDITVRRTDDVLLVEVTDNGTGGARVRSGGLSGLARRVAAYDGQFVLTSPAGGPTTLRVELPCG